MVGLKKRFSLPWLASLCVCACVRASEGVLLNRFLRGGRCGYGVTGGLRMTGEKSKKDKKKVVHGFDGAILLHRRFFCRTWKRLGAGAGCTFVGVHVWSARAAVCVHLAQNKKTESF